MATPASPRGPIAATESERSGLQVDLWLFVVMLGLALLGVAVTQMEYTGGKLYWLFLVLVYAIISVVRAWQGAKAQGGPVWPMVRDQVLHWLGALVAINIVLYFESVDIASRGSAADYSLLILALASYLAGVHFNWAYLLLGGLLAVIAVGLGYLDQMSLYALIIPLSALAVWVYAKRKGSAGAAS
jgi:hypothetical protein